MPSKGRPRLSPEDYQLRVAAYCSRYGVTAQDTGLPPFPAGRRETPQHREWLSLYKAHARLAQRAAVLGPGSACPVCARDGAPHRDCDELVRLARAAGPEAWRRIGAFLWQAHGG